LIKDLLASKTPHFSQIALTLFKALIHSVLLDFHSHKMAIFQEQILPYIFALLEEASGFFSIRQLDLQAMEGRLVMLEIFMATAEIFYVLIQKSKQQSDGQLGLLVTNRTLIGYYRACISYQCGKD